jgi:hypothetical protein
MSDVLDLPPLQGGDGVPLSDLAAPTSKPEETPAPSAPQQFAPLPETIAAPNQIPVVATKEVAMIVPADVKADRKIEFVVDGVKYSAVLPEGLKAGDTFRARIPATPIMLPVVGPAAGESAPKRPKAEESMQQGAKKPKIAKKKREVKSDDDEEEEDESKGQDEIPMEERIASRVRERRSSATPKEDPSAKAWGEHVTPGGIRYWYNTMTGITSWDKPRGWVPGQKPIVPGLAAAPASAPAPAAVPDAPKPSEGAGKQDEDLLAAIGN